MISTMDSIAFYQQQMDSINRKVRKEVLAAKRRWKAHVQNSSKQWQPNKK